MEENNRLEIIGPCPICHGFEEYRCAHCENASIVKDGTKCDACGGLGFHECRWCKPIGPGIGRNEYNEDGTEKVRDIDLDGHRLELFDLNRQTTEGRHIMGYRLTDLGGDIVFEGADFFPSPMVAVDSDEAVRSLIGFLTLRPGDTDEEYFYRYTREQMHFVGAYAEELSVWALEPDDCSGADDVELDEDGEPIWFRPWTEEVPGEDLQEDDD